ncbi:hypothetical protein MKW92_051893 [Papaver armeniacum]|nr:hypothetical protein MKW92_051893 [Papaver armeniacum]
MGTSIIILPFFLFCLLSISAGVEPIVSYPFRIKGRQDEQCGYPGFDLTCDKLNRTVLELPFSEPFLVHEINYDSTYNNEIQLRDPDDCLSRRFLNHLNFSGTPFVGIRFTDYSFFNCSSNISFSFFAPIMYYITHISCLSSSTHTVFAASSGSVDSWWLQRNCSLIASLPVPVEKYYTRRYPYQSHNETVLHLTWQWNESNCKMNCDKTNVPYIGSRSDDQRNKAVLISIGIVVPILVASIIYCKCYCGPYSRSQDVSSGARHITPQPVITTALDVSAIQSFPTIVFSESGRLPKPDINTCAICLSDYQPKETLKSLPGCHHCFHADCITVWLRLNSTCPVCRISPIP